MKVILLEDVKSVGKKGEVVTVKDGYAKNFILKKNLGVEVELYNLSWPAYLAARRFKTSETK